jgi:heme-degrading monooxygenase HmoA
MIRQDKNPMYAVIFKAKVKQLNEAYYTLATRMRELAMAEYGCLEFTSAKEGDLEIAISYWETTEAIVAWKANAEHMVAQAMGKSQWYASYQIQVVEVLRDYSSS